VTVSAGDRLEVEDLATRYNLAIDLGDPAGWVACYTPDAEFEIVAVGARTAACRPLAPGCWRGETELLAFATGVAGVMPCRHWSYNRLLSPASDGLTGADLEGDGLEGDGLTSVSYMNVYYLDAPPQTRLITGVMRDRLVRTEDGWRFASRRITFD
jgi:hypothetical protein